MSNKESMIVYISTHNRIPVRLSSFVLLGARDVGPRDHDSRVGLCTYGHIASGSCFPLLRYRATNGLHSVGVRICTVYDNFDHRANSTT